MRVSMNILTRTSMTEKPDFELWWFLKKFTPLEIRRGRKKRLTFFMLFITFDLFMGVIFMVTRPRFLTGFIAILGRQNYFALLPRRRNGNCISKRLIPSFRNRYGIVAGTKSGKKYLPRRYAGRSKSKWNIRYGWRPGCARGLQECFIAKISVSVVQRVDVLICEGIKSIGSAVRAQKIPCRFVVIGGNLKSDAIRSRVGRLVLRLPKNLMEVACRPSIKSGGYKLSGRHVFYAKWFP